MPRFLHAQCRSSLRFVPLGLFVGLFFVAIMVGSPAHGDESTSDDPSVETGLAAGSTLADYQRLAVLNSPEVAAAYAEWQAALEMVPQARTLPEPRLTLAGYTQAVETRVGPQQARIGVAQALPWFGVIRARTDRASANATAASHKLEGARLALATRVAQAYTAYYFLGRSTTIAEANLDLLTQFEEVARRRYEVAEASYSDVVKAQVEIGTLSDRVRTLTLQRPALASAFNAALNRAPETPIPWPSALPELSPVNAEEMRTSLAMRNPELLSLDSGIEAGRHEEELARLLKYPAVTLGVEWIQTGDALMPVPDSSKDPVVASISFNLPIWRESYRAAEREAAARTRARTQQRVARRNMLLSMLDGTLFRYADARKACSLYRDTLIPKAEQSLQAARTAYSADEGDFLALIDAQRTLLNFELAYERAWADGVAQLAQLEELAGGPDSSVPDEVQP